MPSSVPLGPGDTEVEAELPKVRCDAVLCDEFNELQRLHKRLRARRQEAASDIDDSLLQALDQVDLTLHTLSWALGTIATSPSSRLYQDLAPLLTDQAAKPEPEQFAQHLENCQRCSDPRFDLCQIGAQLLGSARVAAAERIKALGGRQRRKAVSVSIKAQDLLRRARARLRWLKRAAVAYLLLCAAVIANDLATPGRTWPLLSASLYRRPTGKGSETYAGTCVRWPFRSRR